MGYDINSLFILLVGSILLQRGKLNLGLWIAFYFYPQYLWSYIQNLFSYYYDLISHISIWARISEILKYEKDDFYRDIKEKELNSLELKNISFAYGDKKIFENFSYEFKINKIYLIMAESGKGKSTLLRIISRGIKDNKGQILINGKEELYNYPSKNSKIKLGILYQNTDIFKESVKDNIIGPNLFQEEKFDTVLNAVRLNDWIKTLPDKENTILAESGISISGGQIQRIGIARLLYQETNIWLVDEPTASLDIENEKQILRILRDNRQNSIIICVSHSQIFKEIADEVLEL